jgi:uncharacterized protein YjbI with pentapeptide repeats
VAVDGYAGSWIHRGFIQHCYRVSAMVEKQGHKAAGEKQGRKPWTLREFGGKTFWDWLQLLIVPVVLSLITVVFAWQQDNRQNQIEKKRTQQAQKIENKRANAERELAVQRAQDETLQAYLNQMGSLLLERNLRESAKDSEARTLARARTLTVLSRLDSARKERLLQFLYEAGLLHKGKPYKENTVIDLTGADLSGIDLHEDNLSGGGAFSISSTGFFSGVLRKTKAANLSGAILSDANLERALLSDTDLSEADLSEADLSEADLTRALLSDTNLQAANLSKAYLGGADLSFAVLKGADLSKAYLSKDVGFSHSAPTGLHTRNLDLTFANLKNADLSDADLRGTILTNANLSNANLAGAKLTDADLTRADMHGAQGISDEELKTKAKSFAGATMPSGQKIVVTREAKPLKAWFTDVEPPGEYVTDEVFEPAFRFKGSWAVSTAQMAAPWHVFSQKVSPETDEDEALVFSIDPWPEGGQLTFTSPLHVFDPSNPSEPKEVPAPENADEWVSWFQSHPNLETSKPSPASVGGASGMRIDVRPTSTLENYPRDDCAAQPCVFLYPAIALKCCEPPEVSGTSIQRGSMRIYEETKDQYFIVDVKGAPVVINVSAPTDNFDEFLVKAQKILKTVEWESG